MKRWLARLTATWLLCGTGYALAAEELWVWAGANFQVERSVNDLIALLQRAKQAGYDAAVVGDYKFGNFADRPDHFHTNLERTRAAAEKIDIELIPCVMPIGYSSSLLQNNPDLAAGVPVRDQVLVVKDGHLQVASVNLLPGGDFESASKSAPAGFDWADRFALDETIKHSGRSSIRLDEFRKDNDHGNARVVKNIELRPWTQYHLRLWVKTAGLDNPDEFDVKPLVGQHSLNYARIGVKRDQDWTRHDITFNSFEHEAVRLYIGLWAGRGGTIWIDDVELREVAGVNLLRREGCPVVFKREDGSVLTEGVELEPWRSPKTGRVPYPGEFRSYHTPPPIRALSTSGLKEGDALRVSYFHTLTIYEGQVCCCLKHDEVFSHLEQQIKAIKTAWAPKRYFMQHDEIRVAGWCDLCRAAPNSGELLRDNVKRCVSIIRNDVPEAGIIVWSDMFDPHHNAHGGFYHVRGTMAGSWNGLDDQVVLANWNHGKPARSFQHFDGRGHQQIVAGYYDRSNMQPNIRAWRDAAKNGERPLSAFMYTTWRKRYTDLEAFAKLVRDSRP